MRSLGTREVHIRCIVERSRKSLHRRRDFGVCGFDVAVLRDRHVSVPQDSLDDLVENSKLVKISSSAYYWQRGFLMRVLIMLVLFIARSTRQMEGLRTVSGIVRHRRVPVERSAS
jgi:hypothetical protein